ncbi:hypothetical protein VTN77DRAFT_2290 [Rasamsonia byssochlamydoides]|uniref:uncharacterized protein n=1 Tax=Rasamsonia byssochlamydoides TaxID=89139 RepID=UPI0037426F3E
MEQADYDVTDGEEVKRVIVERDFADWDSRQLDLVRNADGKTVVARSLFMLPVGFTWEHRRGVTVIGDAAHLMTPFAGEGVNLALEDALKLAQAIQRAVATHRTEANLRDVLDNHIHSFEKDMHRRATRSQQLTLDVMTALILTPGSPASIIERFVLRYIWSQTPDSLKIVCVLGGVSVSGCGGVCGVFRVYIKEWRCAEIVIILLSLLSGYMIS